MSDKLSGLEVLIVDDDTFLINLTKRILKQLGIEISLPRERVRQIECEALRKIKDHIVD